MSEEKAQAQAPRRTIAERDVIQALHDINQVISVLLREFVDPVGKATLRDALQLLVDLALEHDGMGGYGIYPAFGEESDAPGDEPTDDVLGERSAA